MANIKHIWLWKVLVKLVWADYKIIHAKFSHKVQYLNVSINLFMSTEVQALVLWTLTSHSEPLTLSWKVDTLTTSPCHDTDMQCMDSYQSTTYVIKCNIHINNWGNIITISNLPSAFSFKNKEWGWGGGRRRKLTRAMQIATGMQGIIKYSNSA